MKEFRASADQGDGCSRFNLGALYALGQSVPQDYEEASKWYELAAKQGIAGAQHSLGLIQLHRENYQEAIKWFRLAADQAHSDAQFTLGGLYIEGKGVPQDSREAIKWYRLAADQGSADGQYNLGFIYARGQGVPRDYGEAIKWYRLAADQGHAKGQGGLGLMYEYGLGGLPRDYVQAYLWYSLAIMTDSNIATAVSDREVVSKKMTPAQISQAETLVKNWKPRPKTSEK